MTPLDFFFEFPVRIFDPISAKRATKKLDSEFEGKQEIEYVKGYARIGMGEIKAWNDCYLPHREVRDVEENGFDGTLVMTKTLGDFVCSWSRLRFEENYGKWLLKVENYLEEKEREAHSRYAGSSENSSSEL